MMGRYRVTRTPVVSTFEFGISLGEGIRAAIQQRWYNGNSPPLNWAELIDDRDFVVNDMLRAIIKSTMTAT